jgi:hypothetical protein
VLGTKGAARIGDTVQINDAALLAWILAVGTSLSIPGPIIINGTINSGSSSVRIGD